MLMLFLCSVSADTHVVVLLAQILMENGSETCILQHSHQKWYVLYGMEDNLSQQGHKVLKIPGQCPGTVR